MPSTNNTNICLQNNLMTSWCKIILKHIDYYLKTTDFFLKTIQYIITVNECHDITDHCQLPYLFNSLFRLTTKKHSSSALLALCVGKPLVAQWFPITMGQSCRKHFKVMTSYNIVNSLAPGKFEWNFRHVIFKRILVIDSWGISCEIALIWMSLDFTDDHWTLVQVMAWCRQATSHYLSQCWPRSVSPHGATRPQWVNGTYIIDSQHAELFQRL